VSIHTNPGRRLYKLKQSFSSKSRSLCVRCRIYKYVSGSEATENYDEILKIHLANAISKEEEAATKRVQGSPNTDAATKDNENAVPASQNICNQLATSGGGGADAQNGRSSGPNVESSSEEDKER